MDMVPLQATARDATLSTKKLRRQSKVPCIVYGFEVKELQVQCDEQAIHKAFVAAGESTIVELDVDGKKLPVLFKDIQFDPVTDRETHADFYAVNMKQEIETLVPIHLEGESLAVKDQAGILVVTHDHVRVRCLPKDLPHNLTVNISPLAAFHDSLSVKDLQVPKGVTVLDTPETVLVTVQEPREEEVAPTPEAAPAEGAPGATAEGATPAEGAAAAPAGDAAKAAPKEGGKEKK